MPGSKNLQLRTRNHSFAWDLHVHLLLMRLAHLVELGTLNSPPHSVKLKQVTRRFRLFFWVVDVARKDQKIGVGNRPSPESNWTG